MKKIVFLLLSFILAFNINITEISAKTNVIVHYSRTDDVYNSWSIVVTEANGKSKSFPFDKTDEYGAVAVINTAKLEDIEFKIISEDGLPEVEESRTIYLDKGCEVWIESGKTDVNYEPTKEVAVNKESKLLNFDVYYERYDNDYNDIEITLTERNNEENKVNSKVYDNTATKLSIMAKDDVFINIYKNGELNDYIGVNIPTSSFENEKTIPIRLIQGTELVDYYVKEDDKTIAQNVEIKSAEVIDLDTIEVLYTYPIKLVGGTENFEVKAINYNKDKDAEIVEENVAIKKVTASNDDVFKKLDEGYATKFIIKTTGNIDLSRKHIIRKLEATEVTNSEENASNDEATASLSETSNSEDVTNENNDKKVHSEKTLVLGDIFNTDKFNEAYYYAGNDLGYTYSVEETKFRLYAPTARSVSIVTYENDKLNKEEFTNSYEMVKDVNGTWVYTMPSDCDNLLYNYQVFFDDTINIATDPYARLLTNTGNKSVVVDLSKTEPENFRQTKPSGKYYSKADAIIYGTHISDFTHDKNSGIENRDTFKGVTETNTNIEKDKTEYATGTNHLKKLGITHVLFSPLNAFAYNKESDYNRGFDTISFFAPETDYVKNATSNADYIYELKNMVKVLHDNDIRVILEVSFNHMYDYKNSSLELSFPGYYFKKDSENNISDITGYGNQLNTNNLMARKLVVDSSKYLTKEYMIDGLSFEQMKALDYTTLNAVDTATAKLSKNFLLLGQTKVKGELDANSIYSSAIETNLQKYSSNISSFSNNFSDVVYGSYDRLDGKGFMSGETYKNNQLVRAIAGNTYHRQLSENYEDITNFASEAYSTINSLRTYDGYTLFDKAKSTVDKEQDVLAIQKLGLAVLYTSQGIPYLQAGDEFSTTNKNKIASKYSLSENYLRWKQKTENNELYKYTKGLIELRNNTDAFKCVTTEEISNKLVFKNTDETEVIYTLIGGELDMFMNYLVAFNNSEEEKTIKVNKAEYNVLVDSNYAGFQPLKQVTTDTFVLKPHSALVLGYELNDSYQGEVKVKNGRDVVFTLSFIGVLLFMILILNIIKKKV